MKNFLKTFSKKSNLLIIAIFLFATLVRFYNFPNRVTFWSEQARSLIVSANYLKVPSLLGQEYFRIDSNGHKLFSGAVFNYSLVPLLLISKNNPVIITVFFALLNLFTGLVLYRVVNKLFDRKLAILSTALFLFNDFMIYHSLFIWNYNYLPLVGILILYLLYKKKYFWTGLLNGIGISLQFLFVPLTVLVFLYCIWKSNKKLLNSILFIVGTVIGNLPMIIFDLRHNFYHTRTLWQFLIDTLRGVSDAGFSYYYLLPFWPIFSIGIGFLLLKVFKLNKTLSLGLGILYLYFNLTSSRISFTEPTGMPKGLLTSDIDEVSQVIANDTSGEFNVAEVLDFDKRAYVLRYYLQFKDKKNPQGVADYPSAKVLYVLSEKDYNFSKSDVWEIKSGGLTKINKLTDTGNGYAIYRLEK